MLGDDYGTHDTRVRIEVPNHIKSPQMTSTRVPALRALVHSTRSTLGLNHGRPDRSMDAIPRYVLSSSIHPTSTIEPDFNTTSQQFAPRGRAGGVCRSVGESGDNRPTSSTFYCHFTLAVKYNDSNGRRVKSSASRFTTARIRTIRAVCDHRGRTRRPRRYYKHSERGNIVFDTLHRVISTGARYHRVSRFVAISDAKRIYTHGRQRVGRHRRCLEESDRCSVKDEWNSNPGRCTASHFKDARARSDWNYCSSLMSTH